MVGPSQELSLRLDKLRDVLDDDFVPLRIDVSSGDERAEAVRQRYGATTLPAVVFVDVNGKVLGGLSTLVDDGTLRDEISGAASRRRY